MNINRKNTITCLSIFVVLLVNLFFYIMAELRTNLLLYVGVVNGVVFGFMAGLFFDKALDKANIRTKSMFLGLGVGVMLSVFRITNQISVELYINKSSLFLMPTYIDYFRFYLIGLALGSIKSLYYAITPSVIIFGSIGLLAEAFSRRFRKTDGS